MKDTNADILNTQLNAEEQKEHKEHYSEEMIERIPIENTPFIAVRVENKCFGTFGKYKITEDKKTIPEVEEQLQTINYNTITNLIILILEEEVENAIKRKIEQLGKIRGQELRNIKIENEI